MQHPTRTRPVASALAVIIVTALFAIGLAACSPPTISNVAVTASPIDAPGQNVVTWTTDSTSSSQVFYGPTSSYGSSSTLDTTAVTSHSVTISGLVPGATYHYKVTSTDTATASSADGTFVAFAGNPPPSTGTPNVSTCDPSKGLADELCWYNATGVLNQTTTGDLNDRWTEAQIKAGAASAQLAHIFDVSPGYGTPANPVVLDDPTDFTSGSGTAADPYIYENKWITGSLCVRTSHVVVRNVLIDMTRQGGPCGNGGFMTVATDHETDVTFQDSEVDGQWSTACAIPPWSSCPVVYNTFTNNVMDMLGPFTGQRLNVHGGFVNWGYPDTDNEAYGGANLLDSYMHDLGNFRNWGPGDSRNCSNDDAHRENLHFEFASYWLVKHSFLLAYHPSAQDSGCAVTASLMTGQHSGGWAVVNSYVNGGGSWDLVSCNSGDHLKGVTKNVYHSDRPPGAPYNAGDTWQCGPTTQFSDYQAGTWTEAYTASAIGTLTPIASHSYCEGYYRVTAAGSATKILC